MKLLEVCFRLKFSYFMVDGTFQCNFVVKFNLKQHFTYKSIACKDFYNLIIDLFIDLGRFVSFKPKTAQNAFSSLVLINSDIQH